VQRPFAQEERDREQGGDREAFSTIYLEGSGRTYHLNITKVAQKKIENTQEKPAKKRRTAGSVSAVFLTVED